MNILAIDTATEQCSVAILVGNQTWARAVPTARSHADMILPMIDDLLKTSHVTLAQLDGLAFGRGPGSFTGVRIGVSVIQGLALARGLKVVGISNLAAVAQQAAVKHRLSEGATILVCMDARMQEVYWARYHVVAGLVALLDHEQVGPPSSVTNLEADIGIGTGWLAYSELRQRHPTLPVDDSLLPQALEIAHLSLAEFRAGRASAAADAQPVYLRDQVVFQSRPPVL